MRSFTFFSLAFSLLVIDTVYSVKLPSYVKPCDKDSEHLNRCIANAWESLRPKVGEGIPKLKIPPLEPLLLPEMSMNKTLDSIDMKLIVTQLNVMGLTNVTTSKLNVNLADLKGSVSLAFADLNVTTLYAMDALLMNMIPMKGKGLFNGTISDVRVNVTGKAELSPKDGHGESYLKIVELKMKMFIADVKAFFADTSKNPEYEMFTETANMFYGENKREVIGLLVPLAEEFCESLVLEMANQVLAVVPFEEMFVSAAERHIRREPENFFRLAGLI